MAHYFISLLYVIFFASGDNEDCSHSSSHRAENENSLSSSFFSLIGRSIVSKRVKRIPIKRIHIFQVYTTRLCRWVDDRPDESRSLSLGELTSVFEPRSRLCWVPPHGLYGEKSERIIFSIYTQLTSEICWMCIYFSSQQRSSLLVEPSWHEYTASRRSRNYFFFSCCRAE